MNNLELARNAKRNITLYPIQKIFNKRVFLPIIPIFYTQYVGFSLQQIGLIASSYALANMLFNVPGGYFADKYGRARALRIGAVMMTLSTIIYAAFPTKIGIIIGAICEAIGFAFISGSGEALMHDSLEILGRSKEYSKVLSRAQSIALAINAAILAVVPLTYAIDPRLPFVVGTGAFLTLLVATIYMRDVTHHTVSSRIQWKGLKAVSRISGNVTMLVAIALFGVIGAVYFSFDIVTIALNTLGVSVEYLGWVFAGSSVVAALIGLFVHKLKRLTLNAYMAVDIAILLSVYIAGSIGNVWLFIVAAILSISFWRYRRIIYQDHLLSRYKSNYKTTLLSVMSTTESLNMLWVPIVTTGVVGSFGITHGFGILGIALVLISVVYYAFMHRAFKLPIESPVQ